MTPGVRAETHEYISTGQADSKFGFGIGRGVAIAAVERAAEMSSIELVGIHCHIGSQVFRVESLARALDVVAEFAAPLFGDAGPAAGRLEELSIGGGLGVAYVESEQAPTITEWGDVLSSRWAATRSTARPGSTARCRAGESHCRSGRGDALHGGKHQGSAGCPHLRGRRRRLRRQPAPDAVRSDYTAFMPARAGEPRPERVRLVGKHCESGDVIVRSAPMPAGLAPGDLVATPVTGAYGYSMARPTTASAARQSCSWTAATPSSSSVASPSTTCSPSTFSEPDLVNRRHRSHGSFRPLPSSRPTLRGRRANRRTAPALAARISAGAGRRRPRLSVAHTPIVTSAHRFVRWTIAQVLAAGPARRCWVSSLGPSRRGASCIDPAKAD